MDDKIGLIAPEFAFVAVAVAAFLPPTVAPAISTIFSKIVGYMALI